MFVFPFNFFAGYHSSATILRDHYSTLSLRLPALLRLSYLTVHYRSRSLTIKPALSSQPYFGFTRFGYPPYILKVLRSGGKTVLRQGRFLSGPPLSL